MKRKGPSVPYASRRSPDETCLLEIQYENSKPILLENGSALTSIEPSIAGMYNSTPAYDLPIDACEARTTPSQMVRTTSYSEMRKVSYNTKKDILSTPPSTQPRRVVWISLKPNCATINWRWLVSWDTSVFSMEARVIKQLLTEFTMFLRKHVNAWIRGYTMDQKRTQTLQKMPLTTSLDPWWFQGTCRKENDVMCRKQ